MNKPNKIMFKLIFWVSSVTILSALADEENELVVNTPLGSVKGHHKQSYEGRTFTAFEGIPYAKPPVGDLRFKEPQPVESWKETLYVNKTYICAQFVPILLTQGVMGTEDCLYLYVYVPREKITGNENFDVVIHIHGGAFMLGAPHLLCGPEYLMDKDIIFVNLNYRLGILGFLSTEDEVVPGNNGLKDQVMALKWVKDNIKSFGGNPDSVTITGLSAGGASVHYHYLSPLSKGLFHRGFSQSGTALNVWALSKNPLKKTRQLATSLNCSKESSTETVNCLKEKSTKELILALKDILVYRKIVPFAPFGPVIEKVAENAFLSEHPYKLLLDGKIHEYPWIASNTLNEGVYPVGFFVMYRGLDELDKRWDEVIPAALDYNDTVEAEADRVTISQELKDYYLNNETLGLGNSDKLINLFTDRLFLVDGQEAVRLHAKASKSSVHYYFFEYHLDMKTMFSGKVSGVSHVHDGRLLYPVIGNPEHLSKNDKSMKDLFVQFMYEFATKGKVQFKELDWQSVKASSEEIDYMDVRGPDEIEMKVMKELEASSFWDKLPIKENRHLFQN